MPSPSELEKTPRRELHVFYILDTSGSMSGTPIATLNNAMTETVEVVRQQAKSNADALVKISVLEFNSGFRWLQPQGPEEMEHFIWKDLKAGGLTDMGAALKELDSKLSRHAFLNSMTGAYLPVIIFMTDGYATDDYKKALEQIRKNRWFERGTKIGFAVGEEADAEMITEIVGSAEAVVQTDNLELFARMLKFASVTATMLCSQSRTDDSEISGKVILDKARVDNPDMKGALPGPEPFLGDPYVSSDIDEGDEWLFDDDGGFD